MEVLEVYLGSRGKVRLEGMPSCLAAKLLLFQASIVEAQKPSRVSASKFKQPAGERVHINGVGVLSGTTHNMHPV
jgi:hypothetical protein